MSSRASLIEVDGQPAGVLAWTGQGYRFHAAGPRFLALDGHDFPGSGDAELAARRLVRRTPRRLPRPMIKPV